MREPKAAAALAALTAAAHAPGQAGRHYGQDAAVGRGQVEGLVDAALAHAVDEALHALILVSVGAGDASGRGRQCPSPCSISSDLPTICALGAADKLVFAS